MEKVQHALTRKGRRCISPWFVYEGETSIERLKTQADIVASISVCGDAPPEFVAQCHELDIETYKLVGGRATAFNTAEHASATVQGYLDLCRTHGYDGIDLDFEGLDASLCDSYSAFLRQCARRLHAAGKRLSICVSYLMSTRHTTSATHMEAFYDPEVVGENCDMVRVMCYDMYSMSGKGVGPVSTQPWARDAMMYWLKHVPREKLVMGLPAYSSDFEMRADGKRQHVYAPCPAVPEGTAVERVWLPYEQINSYRYVDEGGLLHLFFASDDVSTRVHLATAQALDLPGIAFWHFRAVTQESWETVRDWLKDGQGYETGEWLVVP